MRRTLLPAGFLIAGSFLLPAGSPQAAVTGEAGGHRFQLEAVTEPLSQPWAMAFLPDGGMLITEKAGRLLHFPPGARRGTAVSGVPESDVVGQGGLMDVILDPDFAANRLIYLSYAKAAGGAAGTEIARGRFENGRLSAVETVFVGQPKVRGGRHFGSRLAFGADGKLYATLGDRGQRPNGQDLSTHWGGVIRIDPDGSVPADNPFVDRPGARPELFTYGNRNPQGMVYDAARGILWAHEHGPRGGDELNRIVSGANYGWPEVTYGRNYSGSEITDRRTAPGVTNPVTVWTPSIAPSGMAVYRGDAFPNWQGDLFVGALVLTHLRRVDLEGTDVIGEDILLDDLGMRIRDVRLGPDGYLYLLFDADGEPLMRMVPAG